MKRYLFLLIISVSMHCLMAQSVDTLTAQKCFVEAPASVLQHIDGMTRLDMIDYFDIGSDRQSSNIYDGKCRILSKTPQSISFEVTENVTCQIFTLNAASARPYIGMITTVPTPFEDSDLQIFNSRWLPIENIFSAPKLSDWLTADGKKHRDYVEQNLPFIMASYTFEPESDTLIITNNMGEYFSKETGSKVMSYLKPELRYSWTGKKFKLIKQ